MDHKKVIFSILATISLFFVMQDPLYAAKGRGEIRRKTPTLAAYRKLKDCRNNLNPLKPIKHIIIISLENRCFDNLYGLFPGANGLSESTVVQVDEDGIPYPSLPPVTTGDNAIPDPRFPLNLPNKPFNIGKYASINERVASPSNLYYGLVLSVNNGANDSYIAYNGLFPSPDPSRYNTFGGGGGSITFGYYLTSSLPLYRTVSEYTLCDNCFQTMLTGTGPNRIYGICGQVVHWDPSVNLPESLVSIASPVPFQRTPTSTVTKDGNIDPAGVYINNLNSANQIFSYNFSPNNLPSLNVPTIGDQLDSKGIAWTWYSGGWKNEFTNPDPEMNFPITTVLPFSYFTNFAPSPHDYSYAKTRTKDASEFLNDLNAGRLPPVVWYQPTGAEGNPDEHPGIAGEGSVIDAEHNAFAIVEAIKNSRYWEECVIFIAYDEGGGSFDHAIPIGGFGNAPDGYGPGPRVPLIVISPFAKKNFVDHTYYDNDLSVMRFIERRFDLPPLTPRVANANDLTNAFNFVNGRLQRN